MSASNAISMTIRRASAGQRQAYAAAALPGTNYLCSEAEERKQVASAQGYDDQVGNADSDDAARDSQQQDALKSGHSALLGKFASAR
jgi:hypothetical protein